MRKFEIVRDDCIEYGVKEIKMPFRATKFSAGYDFFSPIDEVISPNEKKLIWTNVKVMMNEDEMFMIDVTSKMGKQPVILANAIGIIDSDYYGNESTDGNIGFRLFNLGTTDYVIKAGDKIGQGIFVKYLTIDGEELIDNVRKGGYGSTSTGFSN